MKKILFIIVFLHVLQSTHQTNSASADLPKISHTSSALANQRPQYYDPYSQTRKINSPPFDKNDSTSKVLEKIKFRHNNDPFISDEELNTIGYVIAKDVDKKNGSCNVYTIVEILKLLPESKCLDQINPRTGQAPIHTLARLHWVKELRQAICNHTSGTVRTEKPDFYPGSTYAAIVAGILINHIFRLNHAHSKFIYANTILQYIDNAKDALESWFKQYPFCIGLISSRDDRGFSCWFILPRNIRLDIARRFNNQDKENIKKALEELIKQNKISSEEVLEIFNELSITQ